MLSTLPTVPHTLTGEVMADVGRALVVLTQPRDLLDLWVVRDGDMVCVQLDAAGVQSLRDLLSDAVPLMATGSG